MNRQDIIDIVKPKLMAQTRPAYGENGHCEYLTETGESCFVGHLMKNPPPDLDASAVSPLVDAYLTPEVLEHKGFLVTAQELHDYIAELWYEGRITEEEAKQRFEKMFADLESW